MNEETIQARLRLIELDVREINTNIKWIKRVVVIACAIICGLLGFDVSIMM
jgi:hypothetical protein